MSLYNLTSHLRSLINQTRKQGVLLRMPAAWNMLCASLDAIEDCDSAISAYTLQSTTDETGLKYLRLYGLLQALFLQQDAATHIAKSLDVPFELHPALRQIREIRNDSIGHPTHRRGKGETDFYCVIVQISITKDYFEYHRNTPTTEGTRFELIRVNLMDVISEQASLIGSTIKRICEVLEKEENDHRMRYKEEPLAALFHSNLGYYFEKISDAIHRMEFRRMGKAHVELILKVTEQFKSALEERGLWDNSEGVRYHFDNVVHASDRLVLFFEDSSAAGMDDRDAAVFKSYLRSEVDTLKNIAKEIDEEYSSPVTAPDPNDRIGRFISYFDGQLRRISTLQGALHKKILLACLLDTISHVCFPDRTNKVKVTSFVEQFSRWQDAKRVSAPQLLLTLSRKGLQKGKLYCHVKKIVDAWESGDLIEPVCDATFEDLDQIAVSGEKEFLNQRTYIELFYNYRNHLVHNYREPGYGIELSDDGEQPYYHSMTGIQEDEPIKWQLVFPASFFMKLCRDGLAAVEKYLRENNIDPYARYPFGDEWTKVPG